MKASFWGKIEETSGFFTAGSSINDDDIMIIHFHVAKKGYSQIILSLDQRTAPSRWSSAAWAPGHCSNRWCRGCRSHWHECWKPWWGMLSAGNSLNKQGVLDEKTTSLLRFSAKLQPLQFHQQISRWLHIALRCHRCHQCYLPASSARSKMTFEDEAYQHWTRSASREWRTSLGKLWGYWSVSHKVTPKSFLKTEFGSSKKLIIRISTVYQKVFGKIWPNNSTANRKTSLFLAPPGHQIIGFQSCIEITTMDTTSCTHDHMLRSFHNLTMHA